MPLRSPSCKLRLTRISDRLKFQDGPSVAILSVKTLTLFHFSAQNKERLKWSIFIHYILLFLMLTKLMPEVLDKLDVFVLEVEELFVPKVLIARKYL
jgi:hypothetical protein